MASMKGDIVHSITLGSTCLAWTVVTLSSDGKYDNCADKTTRPMYILCEGGGDGDVVEAMPAQPGSLKVRMSAACAIDSVWGATTGGEGVDAGGGTSHDGGWVCGHTLEASGADQDIVEVLFAPMFTADASASEG